MGLNQLTAPPKNPKKTLKIRGQAGAGRSLGSPQKAWDRLRKKEKLGGLYTLGGEF